MARGKSGGIGGAAISIIALVFVVAVVFAAAQLNNIKSVDDAIEFFKSKSDETSECASGSGWDCNPFAPDEDGDSGNTNDEPKDENQAPSGDASGALKDLESVNVVEENDSGYERSEWKHWTGSPCNTREELIKSSGEGVETDDDCRATSGEWSDPYTGDAFSDASKMDVDHVIPLGYAASHGGGGWDTDLKTQFANDKSQLLLVGASPNRSKGDAGPAEWMPPNEEYHCAYVELWVDTASKYKSQGLGITQADKDSLKGTLEGC